MRVRRMIRNLLWRERWAPLAVGPDAKAALHLQYLTFKDLIACNDEVLEAIADMERGLEGRTTFGMAFVRARCVTAASQTYRMIQCLNTLSSGRHSELYQRFTEIQRAAEAVLERGPVSRGGPLSLPLSAVDVSSVDAVGGKSANLGEMMNRAGLPVPQGFALTTEACLEFLEASQLREEIRIHLQSIDAEDAHSLADASRSIREAILSAPIPRRVEAAMAEGYAALASGMGRRPRVALRSSAVGEDGALSFAGQYVSVLNLDSDQLQLAYREVVAGLYTPQAICYRALTGVPEEETPMGVTCLAMVDAAASGVACSADPARPRTGEMIINGAWGLGSGTVEGSVSSDLWVVSKGEPPAVVRKQAGSKETRVDPLPSGGVGSFAVPDTLRSQLCLSPPKVAELARLVLKVEQHYGSPQEVEWALDGEGMLFLLQTRPLHASPLQNDPGDVPPAIEGHALLLRGAAASAGCASGPAFLSHDPDEIHSFPEGAVLVARRSHPQYVRVMEKAAAIVTDIGASAGHMASLAREFGIPAVLDTRRATELLAPGTVVTVDGDRGAVYEGRIEALVARPRRSPARGMVGTRVYRVLEEAAAHVVPLNLTDPRSPEFQARSCRTFHDIGRFVHEKAFEEMFRISDGISHSDLRPLPLAARLPFTVHIIDLGGGLSSKPRARQVPPESVRSLPMRALLEGMTDPGLRWWTPRALSASGFASVTTEALFTPFAEYGERKLGDRSYAIVADAYCNFSSRIGYHFAALDAFCADSPGGNYISFRFKGGAADEGRRIARCVLIERILKRLDFQVERRSDLLNARLRKFDRETTLDRLRMVGRVIIATRQLDMRLHARASVDWYVDAFFGGNYLFEPEFDPGLVRRGP